MNSDETIKSPETAEPENETSSGDSTRSMPSDSEALESATSEDISAGDDRPIILN